jgi:hypothetical protein
MDTQGSVGSFTSDHLRFVMLMQQDNGFARTRELGQVLSRVEASC